MTFCMPVMHFNFLKCQEASLMSFGSHIGNATLLDNRGVGQEYENKAMTALLNVSVQHLNITEYIILLILPLC